MTVSLIIPMYNEEKIIKDTARTLYSFMKSEFGENGFEILFSNDGSTDNSAGAVESLALPEIRVVGYKNNRGKGCAVRTAVAEAKGDIIVFTDADLAYGTDVVRRAYDILVSDSGTGMIIGSRNLDKDGYEGYTFLRRIMSKVYIKVLCIIGGFRLSDSQCGFKAFRTEPAKNIFGRCKVDGFAFDFEVILWAQRLGIKISEMPVKIINHRESKIHVLRDTLKMLRDIIKIKREVKKSPL